MQTGLFWTGSAFSTVFTFLPFAVPTAIYCCARLERKKNGVVLEGYDDLDPAF